MCNLWVSVSYSINQKNSKMTLLRLFTCFSLNKHKAHKFYIHCRSLPLLNNKMNSTSRCRLPCDSKYWLFLNNLCSLTSGHYNRWNKICTTQFVEFVGNSTARCWSWKTKIARSCVSIEKCRVGIRFWSKFIDTFSVI